jgi:hypothetical protein
LWITVQGQDGTGATYFTADPAIGEYLAFTPNDGVIAPTFFQVDGGFTTGFDLLASGSLALLVQDKPAFWTMDSAGATIARVDVNGNGSFVRTSDGASTPFDTGVSASGAGVFDSSGASYFYVAGSALKRATVGAPVTTSTIVSSGATYAVSVSPDGKILQFMEGDDYYVVPVAGGSAPVKVATQTVQMQTGFFTADSKYVISATNWNNAYEVTVSPVGGGGPTAVWSNLAHVIPMLDSRVLLADTSDVLSLADGAGKAPTRLLSASFVEFAESWDKTQIAFQVGKTSPVVYLVPTD